MMMMEKKRPGPPKQRQQQLQQRLAPPGRREPQATIQASAAKRTPPSDKNVSFWAVAVALLCLAGLLWYRVWLLMLPHADDMILFITKCQLLAEGAENDAEITDEIALALLWCAEYGGFGSATDLLATVYD